MSLERECVISLAWSRASASKSPKGRESLYEEIKIYIEKY